MTAPEPFDAATLATMTEVQLREFDVPWPRTEEQLLAIVRALAERQHDYGTCVYAMSIAAEAAFNYIASKLGVTGFQASCADMDILRRTRGMKHGFQIVDYDKLLYPQYAKDLRITPDSLLADPGTRKHIAAEAAKKLAEVGENANPDVAAHWRKLVVLGATS